MENEKPNEDQFISFLKEKFFAVYIPAADAKEASALMTTQEIFESFQRILPSSKYNAEHVAQWLLEREFCLTETGLLKFEWMLKSVNNNS